MRNPIQELQAEELEKEEICRDILNSTRNELYLGMRFLDSALSALRPEIPEFSWLEPMESCFGSLRIN